MKITFLIAINITNLFNTITQFILYKKIKNLIKNNTKIHNILVPIRYIMLS